MVQVEEINGKRSEPCDGDGDAAATEEEAAAAAEVGGGGGGGGGDGDGRDVEKGEREVKRGERRGMVERSLWGFRVLERRKKKAIARVRAEACSMYHPLDLSVLPCRLTLLTLQRAKNCIYRVYIYIYI